MQAQEINDVELASMMLDWAVAQMGNMLMALNELGKSDKKRDEFICERLTAMQDHVNSLRLIVEARKKAQKLSQQKCNSKQDTVGFRGTEGVS